MPQAPNTASWKRTPQSAQIQTRQKTQQMQHRQLMLPWSRVQPRLGKHLAQWGKKLSGREAWSLSRHSTPWTVLLLGVAGKSLA